jgi:hypothetical protein
MKGVWRPSDLRNGSLFEGLRRGPRESFTIVVYTRSIREVKLEARNIAEVIAIAVELLFAFELRN